MAQFCSEKNECRSSRIRSKALRRPVGSGRANDPRRSPVRRGTAVRFKNEAQVVRNRHRQGRADVGAARVALGDPYARKKRRSHDARCLPHHFPGISTLPRQSKHPDMTSHVQHRTALAQDVRALQMVNRASDIPCPPRRLSVGPFVRESLRNADDHPSLDGTAHEHGDVRRRSLSRAPQRGATNLFAFVRFAWTRARKKTF